MNKFSKSIIALLAVTSLFSLAGCAKNTPKNQVATTANWNVRTSTAVEGNYLDYWEKHVEVAEYNISFQKGTNNVYSVSYADGATYTTKFYLEKNYDWTSSDIPEGYRTADAAKEAVYVYETELHIKGAFKLAASGEEKSFEDSTKSICKFRLAGKNLQPVYSKQEVVNTTPNTLGSDNMALISVTTDAVFETYYNYDCTEATVLTTDNTKEAVITEKSTVNLNDKSGYSVFDNSQLRLALRSMTLTGNASRTFNVFAPQNGGITTCNAGVGSATALNLEDETQKSIAKALDDSQPEDYIFFDGTGTGEEAKKTYRYNAVTLSIANDMHGASPVCWYTTVENNDLNTTRCVMIRMSTPVAFGLGTLNYNLSKLNVEEKA